MTQEASEDGTGEACVSRGPPPTQKEGIEVALNQIHGMQMNIQAAVHPTVKAAVPAPQAQTRPAMSGPASVPQDETPARTAPSPQETAGRVDLSREEGKVASYSVSHDGDVVAVSEEGLQAAAEQMTDAVRTQASDRALDGADAAREANRDAKELRDEKIAKPDAAERKQPAADALKKARVAEERAAGERAERIRHEQQEAAQAAAERRAERIRQMQDDAAAGARVEQKVSSLAGYTESQLQQLYREGRISQQDYERHEEERAAQKAERKGEAERSLRAVGRDMATVASVADQMKNDRIAIENVSNPTTAAFVGAMDRVAGREAAAKELSAQGAAAYAEASIQERQTEEKGRLWDYQLLA